MIRLATLSTLALLLLPGTGRATTHVLVPGKSEILIRTDKAGLFGFAGHKHVIRADEFDGTLHLPPEPEETSFHIEIATAGITVIDEDLDPEDVPKVQKEMEESVLEIAEHPGITFTTTSAKWKKRDGDSGKVVFRGELALHGVTREIEIETNVSAEPDRVLLTGEFEIKQKDYGIEPVSVGLGAVKVKNEIKISFEVLATPQPSEGIESLYRSPAR